MTAPRPTDLLGVWLLDRRLVDRTMGEFGRVRGWLQLSLVGSTVHWSETGELSWLGQRFEVTRELRIVRADTELEHWQVCFEDGREFHPWAPGVAVTHPCRNDVYRGLIDVDVTRARMRVLWDVAGPLKQQRIVTRCRRRAEPPAER